jgi:hypothetical protein
MIPDLFYLFTLSGHETFVCLQTGEWTTKDKGQVALGQQ